MAISPKDTKILWASAAGICSFTSCYEKLCLVESGEFAPHIIGEMAHIKGERNGSNRFEPDQENQERNSYSNLILLCPTHHTVIDRPENEAKYTVKLLHDMKSKHEENIANRLSVQVVENKTDVANLIQPLLLENHAVWQNYGPHSEIARQNPHSDDAYAVWRSERLSIIVPNNRNISHILELNRDKFDANELKVISLFPVHARSYERWVTNEIPYNAVIRFPADFSEFIEGCTNAST